METGCSETPKSRCRLLETEGSGVFVLGAYQAIKTLEETKDPLLKLGAIGKIAELMQVLRVPPAIYQTNKAYNTNLAHLDRLINVPKEEGAELMNVKPPSALKK